MSHSVLAEAVSIAEATLSLVRAAGLTGYVWDGRYLRGNTWTEMDAPEPGERASLSDFRAPYVDETPTFFEVPGTLWGDYCGSDYGRSNHRSLLRDYPETFVDTYGGFDSHTLLVSLASLVSSDDPEYLLNLLTGLREQYLLYDESDHSALEMELAEESWDAYLKWDLPRSLREAGVPDDVVDAIDEGDLRERFYTAVWESDYYPYLESASDVVFPMYDDVVEALADFYAPYREATE